MNVLVLGGGGREHALVDALRHAPSVARVWCAPGNPGIAADASVPPVDAWDRAGLARFVEEAAIDLVVPGPESLIADGTADALRGGRARVFAPTAAAARIESSKVLCAELRAQAGLPAPETIVPVSVDEAKDGARALIARRGGVAVKADGLCAGKGVVVAGDVATADEAIDAMMTRGRFGEAGSRVVLEARLRGEEISVLALCDGAQARLLAPAQDYKRLRDGNEGPNTGGMGALAPAPRATDAFLAHVRAAVFAPTLAALRARGTPFSGVLYAGLLCDEDDGGAPKVLEFNARFGDPETQVVLPLFRGDLALTLLAACEGRLVEGPAFERADGAAVCVVLASAGYPEAPRLGDPIEGLGAAAATGARVYHAGTRIEAGRLVTSGGRVLGVTARGADLAAAADLAHAAADAIHFEGLQRRRDIGRATNDAGARP